MTADDVLDVEGPQRFHGLRTDVLHHAAQMQSAHDGVDRDSGEPALDLGAHSLTMPAWEQGAEHDQAEVAHVHDQHALVHQVGIGGPFRFIVTAAEMVGAAGFKGADARDFTAVIEMAIEQQTFRAIVDDGCATGFHFGGHWDFGGGEDGAAGEEDATLVEHSGVDVDRCHGTAFLNDGVDRIRQRAHVVPMAVGDRDRLDLAEVELEVAAVADEDRAFGAGVEQQDVLGLADAGTEAEAVAQIGREECLARDDLGATEDDVGELGDSEQGFAGRRCR